MEIARLDNLTRSIIARSFPSLVTVKLKITLVASDKYIASNGHCLRLSFPLRLSRVADIRFSASDISWMNPDALVGCIVHELVHLERETSYTLRKFIAKRFWYLMSGVERRVDEWRNDHAVMDKGYASELLALHCYHDLKYGESDPWITKEEIKKRASHEPARKWWMELLNHSPQSSAIS